MAEAEVTLRDAIKTIQSSSIVESREGVEDFKRIIRHNKNSSKISTLQDADWHAIFELIFKIVVDTQPKASAAKTSTSRTTNAAADRLGGAASALRHGVEAAVRTIRGKTVRAVLDHVTGTIFYDNGSLCEPLALDMARTMRAIFSYQPHVEHLNDVFSDKGNEWERFAVFCLEFVANAGQAAADENGLSDDEFPSPAGTINGLSHRSSRSTFRNSSQSQGRRSVTRTVTEELIACLRLLTSAPNAPLRFQALPICWATIRALRTSTVSSMAHPDAFTTINNVLIHLRTENIAGTLGLVSHLLRLVRRLWSGKSAALSQMLTTLWLLRPYISNAIRTGQAVALSTELTGLVQSIEGEYFERHDRDKLKTLTLDDVKLRPNADAPSKGAVMIVHFSLRCASIREETNWLLVSVLAYIHSAIMNVEQQDAEAQQDSEEETDARPRPNKRRRLADSLDALVATASKGATHARTGALQVLAFLAQSSALTCKQIGKLVDGLSSTCAADDNGIISSWAFLALAACASQRSASDAKLNACWSSLWQLASRYLNNASSCRAASYSLYVLLHLQLVPQAHVAELLQTITDTMELNGPSHLSDGSSLLLCALMGLSQQYNPVSASKTADSIVSWLARTYTPSRLEDKAYVTQIASLNAKSIASLVQRCLGHSTDGIPASEYPVWDTVARMWLFCEEEDALLEYLLLAPTSERLSNDLWSHPQAISSIAGPVTRLSSETLLLTYLSSEILRSSESWTHIIHPHSRAPSVDILRLVCNACVSLTWLLFGTVYKDVRRQRQLQREVNKLLDIVRDYVSSSRCDQGSVDLWLSTFSAALSGLPSSAIQKKSQIVLYEETICRTIHDGLSRRQLAKDHAIDDDDAMDMDEHTDSQGTQHGTFSGSIVELTNDLDVAYGGTSLRSSTALYTHSLLALHDNAAANSTDIRSASTQITDYIVAQPTDALLSTRDMMVNLSDLGVVLTPDDAERIMDVLGTLLQGYAYSRSEVALGFVLDVMESMIDLWADSGNTELYNFGLDIYDWFAKFAVEDDFFSPNVQKRLSNLLLRLCYVDPDYGAKAEQGSARSTCFQLVSKITIKTHYYLTGRMPTLFGRLVLSVHEGMFSDLQDHLPIDAEWLEGISMRLLYLSKLAAVWPSLLRICVWLIFEVAARVPTSVPHATHCIASLASKIPSQSPQKLFSTFAPQLLYSWLGSRDDGLKVIPFSVFQYDTLHDLLRSQREEIIAQLVMRGDEPGMTLMTKALKMLPKDVVQTAYAKSLAYCIGRDVEVKPTGQVTNPIERRLRDAIGGREVHEMLIAEQWPVIIGHLFLTLRQDSSEEKKHDRSGKFLYKPKITAEELEEKWLKDREAYHEEYKRLTEMKANSHSDRALPQDQEPGFRKKFFCDRLERVYKRANSPTPIWTPSRFNLVARMLVDAIDESLGSLHSCLMIRRLRVLIAMAGSVALDGFGLEMLIHSLRPFVSDSECAEDALGILRYLFQHGSGYLGDAASLPFTTGAVILVVLSISKHAKSKHQSTSLQSQHEDAVRKMLEFRKWLVDHLIDLARRAGSRAHEVLSDALKSLQLPGNARQESSESQLLLFLLDQWKSPSPLCSRADVTEALQLLADDFDLPESATTDCLGGDEGAVLHAQVLWEILETRAVSDQFTIWAAAVIGRAYAATGERPAHRTANGRLDLPEGIEKATGTLQSQKFVARHLSRTLLSRDRVEAGLAEFTLRKIRQSFPLLNQAEEAPEFDGFLTDPIFAAISEGTFGYSPTNILDQPIGMAEDKTISNVLELSRMDSVEDWTARLAIALSAWASSDPIVSSLGPLIRNMRRSAVDLLPSVVHIVLARDKKKTLRTLLSAGVASHMAETDPAFHPKQRFLLSLILYLRSQPLPGEKTIADRLRWLDIDHTLASTTASRCGMPACALLLLESTPPALSDHRRTSKRSSMSQAQGTEDTTELLLSIYRQVEEPDSFYGVQQPASLGSVLSRLDHEGDGFRSLMFRSAQMDSRMRQSHRLDGSDAVGMVQSLTTLNFNSLAFALVTRGLGDPKDCSDQMLSAAQTLQQWNITPPETHQGTKLSFGVLQHLSGASELAQVTDKANTAILDHIKRGVHNRKSAVPPPAWFNDLAVLAEIYEITTSCSEESLSARWSVLQRRQNWMRLARFDDVHPLLNTRQTVFSVLGQNAVLHEKMHLDQRFCRMLEAEALLATASLAREHTRLQEALTATTVLSDMMVSSKAVNLNIEAATKFETALVLWDAGEATASVAMLRDVLEMPNLEKQDLSVGTSGLNARLAHQLGEARLEKPEEIMSVYLKPAIATIGRCRDQQEAGRVYHEFASFCDKELQNPGNIENLTRMTKLRQGREEEMAAAMQAVKDAKKTGSRDAEFRKSYERAKVWLGIDKEEEDRLRKSRKNYVARSLEYYLRALNASDEHDICVLRFFALWLENAGDSEADAVVTKYLPQAPSWKFVRLMNQLISRVEDHSNPFQLALGGLMIRIFREHPYHSFHHLFAAGFGSRGMVGKDATAQSRFRAAASIINDLSSDPTHKDLFARLLRADRKYKVLADNAPELAKGQNKIRVKLFQPALQVAHVIPGSRLPPITVSLKLKPSGDYSDAPVVTGFDDWVSIMGGISAPKLLTARASDGKIYKELFKSGRDDLRQDGIMEQVFEEVSEMLRNHKTTRQRDLKVRTYKVIPLAKTSGVIEFVPNSVPINDYLQPAHLKYYPEDMKNNEARERVGRASNTGVENRVKVFRGICQKLHPVLRFFFLERFSDPDDWFEKRTAYTRTTASISILGHILGLGDRHCSNILLDKVTGEVVHIDLGVSFEAGRVLPVPELIPFRLTRDIIDGMGTTGTEGVFRRCCEFTLDAVREDKDSIMTLLNVLRYDPLYEWSMSPLRAKRMQEAQETGIDGGDLDESSSKKREESAGEAERALSIVEKKLGKTLSTTATVNELIQQATDEKNLASLFQGWAAFF